MTKMPLITLEHKIAFFKAQIAIHHKRIEQISPSDPFHNIKKKALQSHIDCYREELRKLKADDLNSWT